MVKPDHDLLNATDKIKKNNNETNQRDALEVFVGMIPGLEGVIFDVINTKKSGHFNTLKKTIAQYLAKSLRHGGDISHTILYLSMFVIPKPKKAKKPEGNNSDGSLNKDQQDDYDFELELYKARAKAYLVRLEFLEENIHKAFSIFLGQYTVTMVSRLEFNPELINIQDTMDVLNMLELLQKVTYSYEGGTFIITP